MAISKLILNGETQMDVTSNTNVASNMLNGVIGTKNDGTKVTGNIASKTSDDLTVSGATVTAPAGYYANAASKAVATTTHPNPTASIASSTGVVTASHTQSTGYVTGGTTTGTLNLTTQAGKTITPTESVQTAVASYRWTTGKVNVAAISSTYVGTGVTTRSSANLTANGSVVTAPAGYYSTAATKAVAAGSAFPPAVTITKAPTIGVNTSGVVTASYSGSSSITPTVTSGYVSKGTAGTVSITGTSTYQLTSKAAATYYPSTADQTVASQRWLVGNQTFKSVTTTNLTSANIKSGTIVRVGDSANASRITQVIGTYAPSISSLTVTPSTEEQTFNAVGIDGYNPVIVEEIPKTLVMQKLNVLNTIYPTKEDQIIPPLTDIDVLTEPSDLYTIVPASGNIAFQNTYHRAQIGSFSPILDEEIARNYLMQGTISMQVTYSSGGNSYSASWIYHIEFLPTAVDTDRGIVFGVDNSYIDNFVTNNSSYISLQDFDLTFYRNYFYLHTLSKWPITNYTLNINDCDVHFYPIDWGDEYYPGYQPFFTVAGYPLSLTSKTVTPTDKKQIIKANSDNVYTFESINLTNSSSRSYKNLVLDGMTLSNNGLWKISGSITRHDGNIITIPEQLIKLGYAYGTGTFIKYSQSGSSVDNIYFYYIESANSLDIEVINNTDGSIATTVVSLTIEDTRHSAIAEKAYGDPDSTSIDSVNYSTLLIGEKCIFYLSSVLIKSFIYETFTWDGTDKTFSKTLNNNTITIELKPSTNQIIVTGYSGEGFIYFFGKQAEEYDGLSEVIVEPSYEDALIQRTLSGIYSNSKVITIGDGAFMGMTSLNSINFPNASYLYKYAFADCSKLVSAYIPQVTYIYPYAFSGCSILRTFTAGALTGVCEYGFHGCNNLPNIDGSLLTSVGSYAFYACRSLKTFSAPLLTSIGAYAFGVCYSLSTISIPEVSVIGSGAFYNDYITQIYCPKVTSIGNDAFYHVLSLNSINLPSVTYIGDNAFSSAVLKSISMPNIQTIGNSAFRSCKSLSGVLSLPFLSSLGTFAFASCYSLLSIYCPILSVVSDYAFTGCISITSISLPSCTQIGTSGFANCYSLSAANISRCSKVGIGAFYGCTVLSWVYISVSGEAFIGRYAFQGCRSLMSVYLFNRAGYSIIRLSSYDVFTNTPIATSSLTGTFGSIYVYSYYYQSYITASGWSNFSSRIVSLTSSEISAILSQIT